MSGSIVCLLGWSHSFVWWLILVFAGSLDFWFIIACILLLDFWFTGWLYGSVWFVGSIIVRWLLRGLASGAGQDSLDFVDGLCGWAVKTRWLRCMARWSQMI